MKCENILKCPFFNDKMPMDIGLGSMFKKKYCEGDKTNCARYIVSKNVGKEYVDLQLFPNMIERAKQIIKEVQG